MKTFSIYRNINIYVYINICLCVQDTIAYERAPEPVDEEGPEGELMKKPMSKAAPDRRRIRKKSEPKNPAESWYFYGRNEDTQEEVSVRPRSDHVKCIMIFLGNRMVCMMAASYGLEGEAIMISLAQKLLNSEITKEEIYVERNTMMAAKGLEVPAKGKGKGTAGAKKIAKKIAKAQPEPKGTPAKKKARAETSLDWRLPDDIDNVYAGCM